MTDERCVCWTGDERLLNKISHMSLVVLYLLSQSALHCHVGTPRHLPATCTGGGTCQLYPQIWFVGNEHSGHSGPTPSVESLQIITQTYLLTENQHCNISLIKLPTDSYIEYIDIGPVLLVKGDNCVCL